MIEETKRPTFNELLDAALARGERSGQLACRFSQMDALIETLKSRRMRINGLDVQIKEGSYRVRWGCIDAAQKELFTEESPAVSIGRFPS